MRRGTPQPEGFCPDSRTFDLQEIRATKGTEDPQREDLKESLERPVYQVRTVHPWGVPGWTPTVVNSHSFPSGQPGRAAYGKDGREGQRGPRGVDGTPGVPGPPGPPGLNAYCESAQCVMPMVASPVSAKDSSMKGPSEM